MNLDYLINEQKKGRQIIFDLEDTLYPEKQFLFLAYKNISENATGHQDGIYNFLKKTYLTYGRKNIFDKLEEKFTDTGLTVNKCLELLRSTVCPQCFDHYSWVISFIRIAQVSELKIITNGNVQQQMNKVNSINWAVDKKEIVYAELFEPKPSTSSFYKLSRWQDFMDPIYVGDSQSDKKFSENLKIEFFDVKNLL